MFDRVLMLMMTLFNLFIPTLQAPPTIQVWSGVASVSESDLLQQTARIPVSWRVEHRPANTTLLFEQLMVNDTPLNVELPRENPWVASIGDGVVAPRYPHGGREVRLQVRLVRVSDQATLATAALTLAVISSDQWQAADPAACQRSPYPSSMGFEQGIYGLVRQDITGGHLDLWDSPAPIHHQVGELAAAEKFVVVGGPFCYAYPWPSDGTPTLRGWQVRSTVQGLTGWVEEYGISAPGGLAYTIEPFPQAGTLEHYFDPAYCDAAQGFAAHMGLVVGKPAQVTDQVPARGLPLSDAPTWYAGRDQGQSYLQPGEAVTVLEGPVCFKMLGHTTAQSHFRLWRVRSDTTGSEGWTAEYWTYLLGGQQGSYLQPVGADNAAPATFSASPDPVTRGGTLTLRWNVPGVESVSITLLSETGGIFLTSIGDDLPAQGALTTTIPDHYVAQVPLVLLANRTQRAAITIPILCPFASTLTGSCPLTAQTVPAAFQPFEGGMMVWRGDTAAIYVLYNDGRIAQYPDSWGEGQPNPVTDLPPAGRTIPERGFGKVWQMYPDVRSGLGWALAAETGYSMAVEVHPGVWTRPDTLRFTLPDNRIVRELPAGRWDFVTP
jgi:hypothetical protein